MDVLLSILLLTSCVTGGVELRDGRKGTVLGWEGCWVDGDDDDYVLKHTQ